MDTVLHTLVVILFVLIPGFIFRRVYFQGGFSKQFDSKSWSHSLFYSILFGIVIELITISLYAKFYSTIDGNTLIDFYKCISEDDIPIWIFEVKALKSLLVFFLFLLLVSFILGYFIYGLVRGFKFDRKFKSLRFNNQWHYYFTGEIKDFKEYKHINGEFQCTHVDALVNMQTGKNRLYSGFLAEHTICSNTGNLEAIYITFPQRYDEVNRIWKDIKSDVLILPYNQIINLNLRYTFKVKEPLPVEVKAFLITLVFVWVDYFNWLSDYNLLSKILLKLFLTIFFLLFFMLKTNYSTLKKENDLIKKELLRKQFNDSVRVTFFIFIVLSLILWFTK